MFGGVVIIPEPFYSSSPSQTGAGMMVIDEKLFGCPYCGFRIEPGEDLCSRCGNKFEPETKFECPFCGDLVGSDMEECPSCHINFSEFKARVKKTAKTDSMDTLLMDIIKLEANEVKSEAKKFSCPHCDLLLDGSETVCPRCKADLTEGSAFQCPVCGEFVDAEASRCSECGAKFEGEEEVKEEANHQAASTALDEILVSAGHTGPLPELERAPTIEELPPEPVQPVIETTPEPAPEPVPEPIVEPVQEPIQEPVIEPEPAPEPAPEPEVPKRPRQRKLKAKPSGASPKNAK